MSTPAPGSEPPFSTTTTLQSLTVRSPEHASEKGTLSSLPAPPNHPVDAATDPATYPPLWKQLTILLTLNLAMFIDVVSNAALFVVVNQIARDLGVGGSEISWILTSYVITFAAFQLTWGRLADLTSAGWIFVIGIGLVASFNLVLSFITNSIVFFILRALQGVAAAMTIPSSYNVLVRTFAPGKARSRALAILGLVGSVSFSFGVVIGGLFEPVGWPWLFRALAVLSFAAMGLALLIVPKERVHKGISIRTIITRLDLVGLLLSVGALILAVLALTSGPEYGWSDARFSAALPVAVALLVAFFLWEAKGRTEETAMLPAAIWKTPTVKPLVFLTFCPFIFWSATAFGFPTYWQEAHHIPAITTAVRLLPSGTAAFVSSVIIQVWPHLLSLRRWPVFVGVITIALMMIPIVYSDGAVPGHAFWSYIVPSFVVGSFLCQFVFLSINVFVITSVDPRRAGVAGALMSVVMQLGNALGLALLTACLGPGEESRLEWTNYVRGWWAVLGFLVGSAVICGAVAWRELRNARRAGIELPDLSKVDLKALPVA